MLHVYFDHDFDLSTIDESKYISDAVLFFNTINLDGRKREQSILSYIDKCHYYDCKTVIDRFGFKLYSSYLSAGCKAALCVLHQKDFIIDTKECGLNAIDSIINFCNEGYAVIRETGVTFRKLSENIDILFDGIHFIDVDDLNRYICSDYFLKER